MTKHMVDVKVSDYEIGLTKLIGKPIKEIKGYLSQQFGPDATFKITGIVFEDDTEMDVEGEHDFPYLTEYRSQPQPNFDQDTLNRLYEEENGTED